MPATFSRNARNVKRAASFCDAAISANRRNDDMRGAKSGDVMRRVLLILLMIGLGSCTSHSNPTSSPFGDDAFQRHCAACHGQDGKGAGPMARDLLRPPADLSRLSARNGGAFPTAYVVAVLEGHRRAPGFSGAMPDFTGQETGALSGDSIPISLDAILAYLRQIQA